LRTQFNDATLTWSLEGYAQSAGPSAAAWGPPTFESRFVRGCARRPLRDRGGLRYRAIQAGCEARPGTSPNSAPGRQRFLGLFLLPYEPLTTIFELSGSSWERPPLGFSRPCIGPLHPPFAFASASVFFRRSPYLDDNTFVGFQLYRALYLSGRANQLGR
jgi:hypothetical protein